MRRLLFLIAAFFSVLATPVAAQSIMERLVTPGPLASGHARLESKCESCHTSFDKSAQASRCVACHKGVGQDIRTRTRYHGKNSQARTQECRTCHSDHKGRGFALIKLNRTGFDHDQTAYPLKGGHAKVECSQCHGKGNNYRGITQVCASCHKAEDPHKGKLGQRCQTCHSESAWKTVKPFDHASTGFRLTGAHAQETCMSCHQGQVWKGLASSCLACHRADDVHKGSRGTNCAGCHTTAAWKQVTFDHDSTGFSLVGGHAQASCAGCHGTGNANRHPTRTCIGCHRKDDTHKGANGSECSNCHTARSWKQITFDHDRETAFALKGTHRQADCAACHVKPAADVKPPVTCYGCHAQDDDHKGGNGQDCQRCHVESSWKKVDFDHDTMTEFALTGKHASARCEACHTRPPSELKLTSECGSCHAVDDIHKGRLGTNCMRCHDTQAWDGIVRFDHDLTRFPLIGAHGGLDCASCHDDKTYAAKGTTCASCHEDDHHEGALGQPAQCGSCHNSVDWKAWTFDHDSRTDYPLTGRHQGLVCSSCHSRPDDPARQPNECVACHRRDDIHHGRFGEDCQSCHVTDDFRRIRIDRR